MAVVKWKAALGGDGDWGTASNWGTGVVPGATSDVVIDLKGSYTVTINSAEAAHSLLVNAAGADIEVNSTLAIGGTFNLKAGLFDLNSGGDIVGGTISTSGGTLLWNGGTLSSVTFDGDLSLARTTRAQTLNMAGGLTMAGVGGVGPGTIDDTGDASTINVLNNLNLANVTVNIGTSFTGASAIFLQSGVTLTLAANCIVSLAGGAATLGYHGGSGGSSATFIVNNGSIVANYDGGSGKFVVDPANFTNKGTMTITGGTTFDIGLVDPNIGADYPTSFINTGTISVDAKSVLGFGGTLTTSQLAGVSNAGLIEISGTLTNSGSTLLVGPGITLGVMNLASVGAIVGGTIVDNSGSGLTFNGGVLDGVTYEGTLKLINQQSAPSVVSITHSLAMTGANGIGSGTIDVAGYLSSLDVLDASTISNALIEIGSSAGSSGNFVLVGTAGVLTLAANTTVDQTGEYAQFGDLAGLGSGGSMINDGLINADISGGLLIIDPTNFTNAGMINVSTGDKLEIGYLYESSLINFVNTGSISIDTGGELDLSSNLKTSQLTGFTNDGQIVYYGTLTNTGSTLIAGTGSALGNLAIEGLVVGGTISSNGSGLSLGGTIDGVTFDGTMNVPSALIIEGGLSLYGLGGSGAGTINDTGQLILTDTETLGNATINIGNASNQVPASITLAAGAVLTLAENTEVNQIGAFSSIESNPIAGAVTNQGTVTAGFSGGVMTIYVGTLTNAGAINISNGDTLTIGQFGTTTFVNTGIITIGAGSTLSLSTTTTTTQFAGITNGGTLIFSGQLSNTGATLALGAGTALGTLEFTGPFGDIVGGTIVDDGTGLRMGFGGLPNLDGVTYRGTLNMSQALADVTVSNDLNMTGINGSGAGEIDVIGSTSFLAARGASTISNAIIDVGNSSAIYESTIGGLSNSTLTLASDTSIVQTGQYAALGDSPVFLGYLATTITNDGGIVAGLSGGVMTLDPVTFINNGSISISNGEAVNIGTYASTTLTNSGSITVGAGSLLNMQLASGFTNLSGGALSGGSFEVDAGATLQLINDVSITTDSATLILSGAGSMMQSLNTKTSQQVSLETTLAKITATGVLKVLGGRNYATANAVANSGALQLAGGVFASGLLTDNTGSSLSGYGTIASAFVDLGSVFSSGGALIFTGFGDVFAGALSGAEIDFAGGSDTIVTGSSLAAAVVKISGGAAVNINETLTYAGSLSEDAASSFTIAAGDMLTLVGAATFGGKIAQTGALTLGGPTKVAAKLVITTGATWNIGGDVGIAIGASAGSSITLGGTLIKSAGTGVSNIGAKITDNGLVEVASGTLELTAAVAGTGTLKIDTGAALELDSAVAKGGVIVFNGPNATLDLATPARAARTIAGFTAGDFIDLLGVTATSARANKFDQLTIFNGSTKIAVLRLTGSYIGQTFSVSSDGHGGSIIVVSGGGSASASPALFAQAMASVDCRTPGAGASVANTSTVVTAPRLLSPGSH